MLPPPAPLSVPALRDVLGLARLLYAAEARDGADPERLLAIAAAGELLALAHEQATKYERDSLAARAAPIKAAKGLDALATVATSPELQRVVDVARVRVLKLER